jgi:hypothetical protein
LVSPLSDAASAAQRALLVAETGASAVSKVFHCRIRIRSSDWSPAW